MFSRLTTFLLCLLLLGRGALAMPLPEEQQQQQDLEQQVEVMEKQATEILGHLNDYTCKSANHPNPVILLHGLFASEKIGLTELDTWLRSRGFCTFALLYGSYTPSIPILGGLKSIDESSKQIAEFILRVKAKTKAEHINLVGHSECGFLSLYMPKFRENISPAIDKIVAISPPTHDTEVSGLFKLVSNLPTVIQTAIRIIISTVGCKACNDMLRGGGAVKSLNDGKPIVQPGNKATIIASRLDLVVTPPTNSFVDEPNVHKIFTQDYCPNDLAGHVIEVYDKNVWNLVLNSLEGNFNRKIDCKK